MARTGIPTGEGTFVSGDDADSGDGSSGSSGGGGGGFDGGGFGEELGGDPAGDADRDTSGGGGSVDEGEEGVDLDTGFDGGGAPDSGPVGGGADESPPGGGEEVGIDDPDAGDMTTDRLRDDARSDPMEPQTERTVVGGGGRAGTLSAAEVERIQREARRRRRRRRVAGPSSRTGIPTGGGERPAPDTPSEPVGEGADQRVPESPDQDTSTTGTGTTADQPEDIINLSSNDPRYRPDVFETPAEQERFLNLFEQDLRQRTGNPDVVVAPGDVDYQTTEGGSVRGSLDNEAARRISGQAEPGSAVAREQEAARERAERGLETFMEGAVRPFAGQQETGQARTVDLASLGGDPAGRTTRRASVSMPAGGFEQVRGGAQPSDRGPLISMPVGGFQTVRGGLGPGEYREPERYGDVEIRDAGDLPLIGGAVDWFAGLTGREPYGVSDLPSDVRLQTEPTEQLGAGPGPRRTTRGERVTGLEIETLEEGTTLEGALSDASASYSEFASDVGEFSTKLAGPRELVDTAVALGADEEGAETAAQSAVRSTTEFGNLPALGLTAKETAEFAPYAAQEVAEGRGGVSVRTEQTAPTAGRVVGAAGPMGVPEPTRTSVLAIEEEGLAPDIGRDVETAVRETVEYAEENPFEFGGAAAGSLIASAGIMGGAARLSRGAGLATRVAIQPGEELLGYGGNFATRRIAGARTAERLFPGNEPLIFSEEAALRGARRAGGAVRRGGGRVRSRLSSEVARTDVNVGARPGALLGGLEVEVERAEAEEEALGPELDPFDYSDTRLYDPTRTFGETEGVGRTTDPTQAELPQDIGPGLGPRGEAGGFRGGTVEENFEAFMEKERARAAAAEESFIDTEFESRRRFESALDTRPLEREGLGFEQLEIADIRAGEDLVADARSDLRPDTELRYDQEFETEPFLELRGELELETEYELESEFETEFETEQELEYEFEFEDESELEFERDDEPGRGADDVILGPRPGWTRLVERDLLNPFTGE